MLTSRLGAAEAELKRDVKRREVASARLDTLRSVNSKLEETLHTRDEPLHRRLVKTQGPTSAVQKMSAAAMADAAAAASTAAAAAADAAAAQYLVAVPHGNANGGRGADDEHPPFSERCPTLPDRRAAQPPEAAAHIAAEGAGPDAPFSTADLGLHAPSSPQLPEEEAGFEADFSEYPSEEPP